MASGLCGAFVWHKDWAVAAASPEFVRYCNAAVRAVKAPSVENRFQLHPAIKHSTFNTICEIKMPASSLLLFATGAELSALSFVTSAELESGSFATGSPQYEAVSTTRCLPLLSAVINLQPVGKSMWASESYVLVLTHRYMYHIRVQCTGSSEHRSDDIELVQTLKIPMHPDVYSMTSIPHSHISCAALMASGPSIDSNDVLYLWDHVAGLRLHSKGSGRYTSAAEGSGAQIPLPAVQYSHHPQVLNQSWLRRLQRVDLRTAAPHLMYETSDSYIINSSVSPRSTLHATDHSFGGTDDHHVLLSQSSRQILLIDVRHSARPLATRPAPAFSHCHMRSYAAADFCCDESVSNSSVLFLGSSRCSPYSYVHSVSPFELGVDSNNTKAFKSVFFNACTDFGAVGNLAWDVSVLRTHRHPSVSPMDSAEGLLGLELVALGEMKETSTSRDFNFLEDSKGDDNDGTSKYNALFCQQNALTGDLTVQRLYIGRASTQLCVTDSDERVSIRHRERLRKSVHTNPLKSVAESNTGLSIPAHIEYNEVDVLLVNVCGTDIKKRGIGSFAASQNVKSFVAASLDIVVKGLNTYGTLTLYELFRFVFSNGKSVMKERFIKKSLKPGVLKEFRKLVASQYVLKGLISEQMLESVYIDSQLMDSLGDDLIVAGPAQAFKSNRLGCTCLAENTLLRPQPGSEGYCVELLQTPCSSPDCPFPYLLVYSLPARDLGAQSWGQIAPILSCQAVFDAAVSVNKRSRIDANSDTTQSEINRPLASFSDISAIDMIQLKKSWTSQRNEDWLANL